MSSKIIRDTIKEYIEDNNSLSVFEYAGQVNTDEIPKTGAFMMLQFFPESLVRIALNNCYRETGSFSVTIVTNTVREQQTNRDFILDTYESLVPFFSEVQIDKKIYLTSIVPVAFNSDFSFQEYGEISGTIRVSFYREYKL